MTLRGLAPINGAQLRKLVSAHEARPELRNVDEGVLDVDHRSLGHGVSSRGWRSMKSAWSMANAWRPNSANTAARAKFAR